MSLIDQNAPDSNPVVHRLLEESRAAQIARLDGRERIAVIATAFAFVAAAAAFALFVDGGREFDPGIALALVGLYLLAARVEFHTGSGWTDPTQLVFVPMLFLLPVNVVPMFVAAAMLLFRLPEYLRREVHPDRSLVQLCSSWYAIGPAAVLAIAGPADPTWGDWPIYLAALGAQFGLDVASSYFRECLGYGLKVSDLLAEYRAISLVDLLLSPVGLLVAFASVEEEWTFLAILPLLGLLVIFAHEREARFDNALALSHAYHGTAHLLGELLSGTHEYTGSHSRNVVALAERVATALGFDEREIRDVEFAALLHDVGKISVPNEMLDKPGPLDAEEWEVMKRHTLEGQRMLEQVGGALGEVGVIVRSHHEHFDGAGYPDGLMGEEIPRAARVIAVCDAFNAMTTDRSYRTAMSREAAIEELRACSGTQFDPGVVEVLVSIVKSDKALGAGPTPCGPVMARHEEATRAFR
ncbi:MAG TPA: HD-GYP domain-containing protein [Solirubrobacterales bacterium]